MPAQSKIEAVEAFKERLSTAQGVVIADFSGLDVESITELRRKCRKAETRFLVVKNTLAIHAIKQVGMDGLEEFLSGPTGWAIADSDPIAPAKILSDFAKEHKLPKIKGGFIDGRVVSPDEVAEVAKLPSKPVLIAQIAGLINAPVQGIAGGIQAVLASLALAVEEVRKVKEAGGGPTSSTDSAESASSEAAPAKEEPAKAEESGDAPDAKEES